VRSLEIAALLFFALLGMGHRARRRGRVRRPLQSRRCRAGQALEYARADYGDVAETPEFIINSTITVIRGAIFLFFALSQLLSLGVWAHVAGGAVGGFAIGRRRRSAARAAMGRMMLRLSAPASEHHRGGHARRCGRQGGGRRAA
jgi:hypothetical protein